MRTAATTITGQSFRLAAEPSRTAAPVQAVGTLTLSLHHDLAALRDSWTAFEEIADGTVFQTYEWLAAHQLFIGAARGEMPCIAIGRASDCTMACLLPLAIRQAGFVRELAWLGDELCDYNAPLLAPDFAAAFGQAEFATLWRDLLALLQADQRTAFDVVRLTKMPEHVGRQANPLVAVLQTKLNASGSYVTSLGSGWDVFYAAKRSSSTRSRDRSKRKRLAECGEIFFRTPKNARDIAQALDTLMEQKSAVFDERGISNIFLRPGYAEFYRAVATDPRFRRIAHVSTLDVGAETSAVNLGLVFRGRYYYVLSSYTTGPLARLSPGMIHLHELMRYAIDCDLTSFDFTIGDESYKRDWCDGVRPLHDHIAAATARGALIALPLQLAQRFKRTIKHTPALWSLFSRVRAALGAARSVGKRREMAPHAYGKSKSSSADRRRDPSTIHSFDRN